MPYIPAQREYRAFGDPTLIEDNSQELIVRGIPVVFNSPTVICEIDGIEYKEQIDPGAFNGCDMSDFIFNRNHGFNDGTVYARSKNNSITYQITQRGLEFEAHLDNEDERHRALYRDIEKGRIDKMSFSFVAKEDSYNRETHTRTVLRFKKLYDVSAVDFPAYNDTSITTARDLFSEEHEKELRELEELRRRKILIAKTLI